ncbi:MAG: hypothetical protein LBD54_01610, partial [Puniceicoccales bacterium]|nr:hypothetical protein [Puniceicoccales bacterium]
MQALLNENKSLPSWLDAPDWGEKLSGWNKQLLELWEKFPLELRDALQRLGVVEEWRETLTRAESLPFLHKLRISYSFHQLPSLPAQISLASVDAKLPKPYALLCRSGENLEMLRCVRLYDERENAAPCRQLPGDYLLRNKTGDVSGDPFYQFELLGARKGPMAFYLLFLSPDSRGGLFGYLTFHIFSTDKLDPQTYIQNLPRVSSASTAPAGRAPAAPEDREPRASGNRTPGATPGPASSPRAGSQPEAPPRARESAPPTAPLAPGRPAGSNPPEMKWKDVANADIGQISGLGDGDATFAISLVEGRRKIVCIPQFPQGQLIKPIEDDDPKIPIFYAIWRGLSAELRMELQRLGVAEERADGVVLHHALEVSYDFHQSSVWPIHLNVDRAEINLEKVSYALRYRSVGENTHLRCLRPYDEDGDSACCCRFPNGYLLRNGGVSGRGNPCVEDNPFYHFELSGEKNRVQSAYLLIVHPSHPRTKKPYFGLTFYVFSAEPIEHPEYYIQDTSWQEGIPAVVERGSAIPPRVPSVGQSPKSPGSVPELENPGPEFEPASPETGHEPRSEPANRKPGPEPENPSSDPGPESESINPNPESGPTSPGPTETQAANGASPASSPEAETSPAAPQTDESPSSPEAESAPAAPPPLDRGTLYREAGIGDARAFHQKLFPDLFGKAAYNPDLVELLDDCCFGSLLDLERLLSNLRDLPSTCLFIADGGRRDDLLGSLPIPLKKGEIVPQIDVDTLKRDNASLSSLVAIVLDAERYNAFAKVLWWHVRSVIVADKEVAPELFSIEDAKDTLCILDENVPVGKRLLDAVANLDEPEFKCTEWKILSVSNHANASGYLGSLFFVLPGTDHDIPLENRAKADHLIAYLYRYAFERIVSSELVRDFSRKTREKIEAQEAEVARRSALAAQRSMQRLRNCTLAEDTRNGKYSCEAMVPWYRTPPDELDVKNRFVRALFFGLQVLVSPVKNGVLEPVAMGVPEQLVVRSFPLLNSSLLIEGILTPIFSNYFSSRGAHVWPQSDFSHLLIEERDKGGPTEERWRNVFLRWINGITLQPFSEAGKPVAGLFFDQPMVCYVIDRLQALAATCLAQKTADQIRGPIELLLRAFNIFAEKSDACLPGQFSGVALMFCVLGYSDHSLSSLSARDLCNGIMRIVAEKRFADVFGNLNPHVWMAFREGLGRAYGVEGKEPPADGHPEGSLRLSNVVEAAMTHGISVNDHFYLASMENPNDPRIYVCNGAFHREGQCDPAVQAKCQQLMSIVLTPEVVVEELLQCPLCDELLRKFLLEERRLPEAQLHEHLRGDEEKREVIIDMLKKYGYLVEKEPAQAADESLPASSPEAETSPAAPQTDESPSSPEAESAPAAPPPLDRGTLYREAGIGDARAFHQKLFPKLFGKAAYNPDLVKLLDDCCFGSLLDLNRLRQGLKELMASRRFIAESDLRQAQSGLQIPLRSEGVDVKANERIYPSIDISSLRNSSVDSRVIRAAGNCNDFAWGAWIEHPKPVVVTDGEVFAQEPCSIGCLKDALMLLDDNNGSDKNLIGSAASSGCTELSVLSIPKNATEANYFGSKFIILRTTWNSLENGSPEQQKALQLIALLYQHTYDRVVADSDFAVKFLKDVKQRSEVAYRPVFDLQQLDRYMIAEDTSNGKFSCETLLALVPDELKGLSPLAFKNHFAKILLSGMRVLLSPIRDDRLQLIDMAILDDTIIRYELDRGRGESLQVAYESLNGLEDAFRNYYHDRFAADQVANKEDKPPSCYAYAVLKLLDESRWNWGYHYKTFLERIRDDPLTTSGPSPMGLFFNRPGIYYVAARLQQLIKFCIDNREMSLIRDTLDKLAQAFQVLAISLKACQVARFEGVVTILTQLTFGDSYFQSLSLKDEVDVLMHMSIESRFNYVSSKVPIAIKIYPGFAPHAKLSFRRALDGMYGVIAAEDPSAVGDNTVFFGTILLSARKQGIDTSFRLEREHEDMFRYDGLTDETKQNCRELMRRIMAPMALINTVAENPRGYLAAQRFLREKH